METLEAVAGIENYLPEIGRLVIVAVERHLSHSAHSEQADYYGLQRE